MIIQGDSLDLIRGWGRKIDLVVTDPPYAFGGDGDEHALSATVAVVLRETAKKLARGRWMLVFCASSWRSTSYMVESVRGILRPVRVGHWLKPTCRTKAKTTGWSWTSVNVIVFCKGKASKDRPLDTTPTLDHITCPPVVRGRRAQLPREVARWAVQPYSIAGGVFLDPFAGSGVLVDAADEAGMNASGFEISPAKEERRPLLELMA